MYKVTACKHLFLFWFFNEEARYVLYIILCSFCCNMNIFLDAIFRRYSIWRRMSATSGTCGCDGGGGEEKRNVYTYDVAVMGAGPCAFSLALQFAKQDPRKGNPKTLAILSSAPEEGDDIGYDLTQLYQGKLSGLLAQQRYKDYLYMGRLREFGGTTNHWGGWNWPFEEYEIAEWPIEYQELVEYWKRVQHDVMRMGTKENPQFEYDDIDWWIKQGAKMDKVWEQIPETHDLKTRILQVQNFDFRTAHRKTIEDCPWITIHHNCNVVKVETVEKGDQCEITAMVAKEIRDGRVGRTMYFNAAYHVLGAGAIENTRFLLLNQTKQFPGGIGSSSGHLGQHFRDQTFFNNYEMMSFKLKDDCPIGIKNLYFNLKGNSLYGESKFTATLVPHEKLVKRKKIGSFRCVFGGVDQTPKIGIIAASVEPRNSRGFIALTDEMPVDLFGQQRVHVNWQLTDTAIKTAKVMFEETFKVLEPYIDPDSVIKPDMENFTNEEWCPDLHPEGSTRMSYKRSDGVVDPNLRVFDTTNLFVTGSSTFPTSGYENPTFTLCALATRLADHLLTQSYDDPPPPVDPIPRIIGNVTIASVQAKLQQALMLELSTIPLYLSAMYSLVENPAKEGECPTWYDFAYPRLWSILKQEMLHMALVANIIKATGVDLMFND